MENASKALIIAGAILISIVIISLGVMIVSNVMETIQNSSSVSEQEREAYNQPFLAYEGTKSGTQVRALCQKVLTHNQGYPDDVSRHITIVYADSGSSVTGLPTAVPSTAVTDSSITTIKNKIKTGNTYTVSFSYDTNSGYVVGVGILKK